MHISSADSVASGEEFFPSRLHRPHPATEELRQEAARRRVLVAKRIMSEVARLPFYAQRARSARDTEGELKFWLDLVECGDSGLPLSFDSSHRPERKAIHDAVARVAHMLQSLDHRSDLCFHDTQLTRMRAASWVVLNRWPIEAGRMWYLRCLGMAIDAAAMERAIDLTRHDWIAEAAHELRRASRACAACTSPSPP